MNRASLENFKGNTVTGWFVSSLDGGAAITANNIAVLSKAETL